MWGDFSLQPGTATTGANHLPQSGTFACFRYILSGDRQNASSSHAGQRTVISNPTRFLRIAVGLCLALLTVSIADAQFGFGKRNRNDSQGSRFTATEMPGESYRGPLPKLTAEQIKVRDFLKSDLARLAGLIGERNVQHPENYAAAALFLEKSLGEMGYDVKRQEYRAGGHPCMNLSASVPGNDKAGQIVVVGAHYDSLSGSPGANDNGTGVVATLALARMFAKHKPVRTLRLVFFANEESPYFQTSQMGSLVYAKACRAKEENIAAMLSLETIGYYSDVKNSQQYPAALRSFYPSTGNFIAFVGNTRSKELVTQSIAAFRAHAKFPSEWAALPAQYGDIGRSDHWSFWQVDYPAIMVTDTAPFRYPHYHRASDTIDKIDYDRMARVVSGLESVVADLLSGH